MDLVGRSMLTAYPGSSVSLKNCTFADNILRNDASARSAIMNAHGGPAGGMFRLEGVRVISEAGKQPLLQELPANGPTRKAPSFYSDTDFKVACGGSGRGMCQAGSTAPLAEVQKLPADSFLSLQDDWLKDTQKVSF